jgi:hypothetical protein
MTKQSMRSACRKLSDRENTSDAAAKLARISTASTNAFGFGVDALANGHSDIE